MTRRDELLYERDRLIWNMMNAAGALTEAVEKAMMMGYNSHITNEPQIHSEDGLAFVIDYLKRKSEVGKVLLGESR